MESWILWFHPSGKNTELVLSSAYCPMITVWENYAMPIVSASSSSLNFFFRERTKTKSYRFKMIVWPKWKFFFRRRVRPSISRQLLCYGQKSTTYGKGALLCVLHSGWRPIHFQWFQRQQHNLPVKVLCNCGWRERDEMRERCRI